MQRLVWISAALLAGGLARAQTVDFELRTYPDSPVSFSGSAVDPAPGVPRRQFVTIRNDSQKSLAAVLFEQSVARGEKLSIVALERVEIVALAGAKKRVSLAVADMSQKLQSGEPLGRPVLRVVAVEFLDGSEWNAPTGAGRSGETAPDHAGGLAGRSVGSRALDVVDDQEFNGAFGGLELETELLLDRG